MYDTQQLTLKLLSFQPDQNYQQHRVWPSKMLLFGFNSFLGLSCCSWSALLARSDVASPATRSEKTFFFCDVAKILTLSGESLYMVLISTQ